MANFFHILLLLSSIQGISGHTCPCSTLDKCSQQKREEQKETAASCIKSCGRHLTEPYSDHASNIQGCYARTENDLFLKVASSYQKCLGGTGRGCMSSVARAFPATESKLGVAICRDGRATEGICNGNNGYRCPTGTFCAVGNLCCRSGSPICPNNQFPTTTCANNVCPANTYCYLGQCCPSTTSQCPTNVPVYGGNCVNGQCQSSGFSCYNNNACCRPNALTCPAGQQAYGFCNNYQCPSGYSCTNGVCCQQAAAQCPSNVPVSGGACTNGRCNINFSCYGTVCCRPSSAICPTGQQANGYCTNNACGTTGYTCTNGVCCRAQTQQCPSIQPVSGGACSNGQCGSTYSCLSNVCCRAASAVCPAGQLPSGYCTNFICQAGYSCQNGVCCSTASTLCPDGSQSTTPCQNRLCAVGFTCTSANLCCPTTATCPGSLPSVGNCPNPTDVCPRGSTCQNKLCCPIPRKRSKRQAAGLLGPLTSDEVTLDMNLQGYDNCVRNCNTQATSTTFDAVCAAQNTCTVSGASGSSTCSSQTAVQRDNVKTSFCSCLNALGISCTPSNAD